MSLENQSLQSVNQVLIDGNPGLVAIVREATLLYQADDRPLARPVILSPDESRDRGRREFNQRYPKAMAFLSGANFYLRSDQRAAAEAIDPRFTAARPRNTAFERTAFTCVCRAYTGARYGRSFPVSPEAAAWMVERAHAPAMVATGICGERLGTLQGSCVIDLEPDGGGHAVRL